MFERTRKVMRTTRRALTAGAAGVMCSTLWDSLSPHDKEELGSTFPRMMNQIPDLRRALEGTVAQEIMRNLLDGEDGPTLCEGCDELAQFGAGCTEHYGVDRGTWLEATDGGPVDIALCMGCLRDRVGRDLVVTTPPKNEPNLRAVVHALREDAH